MKIKHWAVTRTWEALAGVISRRAGRSSALRGAEVLRRLEQLDRPRPGATHDGGAGGHQQSAMVEIARRQAIAVLSLAAMLIATAGRGQTQGTNSVQFSGSAANYSLTLNCSGFGSVTVSVPFRGDVANVRIAESRIHPDNKGRDVCATLDSLVLR